jgi:zinc protease
MKISRIHQILALLLLSVNCPAQPPLRQQAPSAATSTVPNVKLVPEMPPPGPPQPFHFPQAATKTLANGMRVFVVSARAGAENGVDPAVSIELLLRDAGSSRDPADKPGMAALTAELLTQGTDKRSAQDIAQAIDFVGGSLSAGAGRDATTIRASVVKKDFDLAMDLLSDIALHARFASEEIERQREQSLSGLRVQYSDTNYLASAVFRRVIFGANSYGLPAEGTPASIAAITRDDLVSFRDQFYAPNEALMAFAGDITPDEAFAAAEKFFGAWPVKASRMILSAVAPQTRGMRVVVVNKPDSVQTQIRAGRPGIPRNSPDYLPLAVTNQIFGGGYNSRLNTEVRLKKGLTYDASASFTSYLRSGDFQARTFTRTETSVDATKLVVDEIARMATGEVSADELNVARDYLAGVFTISSETPAEVADRVVTAAFYGLPEDYNQNFPEKVRGITADEVRQMAARYFNASDLDLVLVGNASKFAEALKQAFPSAQFEEIPLEQLDLLAPNLRRTPAPASAALP